MNNLQTEKSSNKKNSQRAGNFQDNSSSTQKNDRTRNQNFQNRSETRRQDSSSGGAMSMIPVSAISSAVTSQLVDNLAPRILEDIKEHLIGEFGEEKVESWVVFLKGEEIGDENAIYTMIRNAAPTLPEELSLSSIMDWAPIRTRVSKSPVAAAAAVAAGVGALYLTREMLKSGNFSFAGVNNALKSGKAKLKAATGVGKKKLANTGKTTIKSATKASGSKKSARA